MPWAKHSSFFFLALAALTMIGCGKKETEFHAYQELKSAPESHAEAKSGSTDPIENADSVPPTSVKAGEPEIKPEDVTASRADDPGNSTAAAEAGPPAANETIVAIAELPALLLLKSGENSQAAGRQAVESIESVEPASTVAVAEIPEAPPRKIELLVPERDFKTELGALRVSYDDLDLLKVLNMDPVTPNAAELLPHWLKELNVKRVRIRGFMYPPFEETGLRHFVLARDNQICCFGRNPKVYDLITVLMRKDVTTDYIPNRPFDVVGVFHIAPDGDAEHLDELSRIDDAMVIVR